MEFGGAAEKGNRGPEAGPTWAERARLAPLEAVLDPADTGGGKNRLIDRAHKHALARAVGEVHERQVLDFGCGTGRLSDWFVRRGAVVEGVDITPEMVEVARQRVPQARFQSIDGATLPFVDERFDLVVTAGVLQYYVGGDTAIPRELARVIRAGGQLLAIEQVTGSDLGRGGPLSAYRRMLEAAGLTVLGNSTIRVSDSRIVGLAARYPIISRLPTVPWFVTRNAGGPGEPPLGRGQYADILFRAAKPSVGAVDPTSA